MRKSVLSYRLLVVALGVFASLPMAAKAASSSSVTITGKVPVSCNISVAAASGASNIADLSQGNTNLLVATVTENCNDPSGYTVTLAGTNSASYTGLFKDSVSSATEPFTVAYNGTAVSSATVTDVTAPANVSKSVQITYAANANLTGSVGYTYAETLTFAITAK
jgi:hypothetical protein